jgi:hypothetical protein
MDLRERVEPHVALLERSEAHRMRFVSGATRGIHHLLAAQQSLHHADVLAHRARARGALPQHAHGGVARADHGKDAARRQRVHGGNPVGCVDRKPHAAHRDAAADLDRLRFHRHGRHGGEEIRTYQRRVRHPAAREAQAFPVLHKIEA